MFLRETRVVVCPSLTVVPELDKRWTVERPHDRWNPRERKPGGFGFKPNAFVLGILVVIAGAVIYVLVNGEVAALLAWRKGLESYTASASMEPALTRDTVVFGQPVVPGEAAETVTRGSVVAFRAGPTPTFGERDLYLKRVIAVPGDRVEAVILYRQEGRFDMLPF